jgi:hypothetical protein
VHKGTLAKAQLLPTRGYRFDRGLATAVEGEPMLWPGFVQLGADHFNALMNGAAVPLDQRHVLWLSKKANGGSLAFVTLKRGQNIKYSRNETILIFRRPRPPSTQALLLCSMQLRHTMRFTGECRSG